MSIREEIVNFYDQIRNDTFHRYKSWEHCYSYFQLAKKIDYDYAALQLAFYLASWGMYRGSSYLLWKDYKIHEELIKNIENNICFKLEMKKENDEKNIEYIIKAINSIKDYYSKKIKTVNGIEKEVKPSTTLATKVLLGINGCIPAFDRFFMTGLKLKNIGKSINKKTVKNLFEYYRSNEKEFEKASKYIQKHSGMEYPPMKLIDMYFWEIGRKEEEQIKRRKNLSTAST